MTHKHFQAGVTVLEEPYQTPHVTGGKISGEGNGGLVRPGSQFDGGGSKIIGGLRLAGTFWEVYGLTLFAEPYGEGAEPVGTGIQVHRSGPGIGAGGHNLHDLSLIGYEHGIRMGEAPADVNCDGMLIANTSFFRCQNAITLKNGQSMGHHIENIKSVRCKNFLKVEAGGDVWVESVTMIGGTLLALQDVSGRYMGHNNADYRFQGVKYDSQSEDELKLVEMEQDFLSGTASFEHVHFAIPGGVEPEVTHLQLKGGFATTLDRCKNLRTRSIVAEPNRRGEMPNIKITRSSITGDPRDLLRDGKCWLTVEDCYDGRAGRATNYSGMIYAN